MKIKPNKKTIFLSIGILITILLIIIITPKQLYKENKQCECFGLKTANNAKCIGFANSCEIKPMQAQECKEVTCEDINFLLHGKQAQKVSKVMLIIDTSQSMEGSKLNAAKEAALKIVTDKKVDDKIGIIALNDHATLTQAFTQSTQVLEEKIQSINTSGATNYLPSLTLAKNEFDKDKIESTKGIIFLSDGIPNDDATEIIQKSNEIKNNDISIFVINFEENETQENEVLEQIASSPKSTWYRTSVKDTAINDVFYEAYKEITDLKIINIEKAYTRQNFSLLQTNQLVLTANIGDKKIAAADLENSLCLPDFKLSITAERNNKTEIMHLQASQDIYKPKNQITTVGNYSLKALASVNVGSCTLTGEKELGEITVTEFEECIPVTCEEAKEILKDLDHAQSMQTSFPRTSEKIRLAITIDSSESMSANFKDARRVALRVNEYLSEDDQRALITFADRSELTLPLTTQKQELIQKIDTLHLQGTTKIIPAIKKIRNLFSENKQKDIAILLTDGNYHDQEPESTIIEQAKTVVDKSTCLYILGFGTYLLDNKQRQETLIKIAEYSQKRLACGGYFHSPEAKNLIDIVIEIFEGQIQKDNDIMLNTNLKEVYEYGEEISIRANVISTTSGIILPTKKNTYCIGEPQVTLEINNKPEDLEIAGNTFYKRLNYLLPDKHKIKIEAKVQTTTCELKATEEKEIIIVGNPYDPKGENIVIALILFCIATSLILMYFYWKEEDKEDEEQAIKEEIEKPIKEEKSKQEETEKKRHNIKHKSQ